MRWWALAKPTALAPYGLNLLDLCYLAAAFFFRTGGENALGALPDFADLHRQLQQHSHLTQQLLWEEYRRDLGQFCQPLALRFMRFS